MTVTVGERDALIITDPQIDFMPGGVLAVPRGDEIFELLNPLVHRFPLVIASQDWHPANHISFKERGGGWPHHCVQGTPGAELHPALDQSRVSLVVRKAYNPEVEQYSIFDEFSRLSDMLKGRGIDRVFMGGVATDYCVRFSTLGALEGGLAVFILIDAVRAIDVEPGDGARALVEMEAAGGSLVTSVDLTF